MTRLAIIAYFKNEGHILDEWIRHHLDFGVDHFFLLDNGSSDNPRKILLEHQDKITLISCPESPQVRAYKRTYKIAKNLFDWIAVIDLDEFLYTKQGAPSIKEYLQSFPPEIRSITVDWRVFVPSRLFQPCSAIAGFTLAFEKDLISTNPYKSIFRTSIEPHSIGVHSPRIPNDQKVSLSRNTDSLGLNHYRFQSYEYLLGIKSNRGGGINKNKYRLHNLQLMLGRHFETSVVEDHELATISTELTSKLNERSESRHALATDTFGSWKQVLASIEQLRKIEDIRQLHRAIFKILSA
jgi:hypothetical protein